MKTFRVVLYMIVVGVQLGIAGCTPPRPVPVSPPPPTPTAPTPAPAVSSSRPAPPQQSQQHESSVVIEPDHRISVQNPIYHPGTTNSLDLSGTFDGPTTVKFTGKITLIVTKEASHGKPVNVMNTAIEITMPDGKLHQDKIEEIYQAQSNGKLKMLYKDSGSGKKFVNSTTCSGEPKEFVEGDADGCEVHFDDGSVEKTTSAVVKDGDNLKVTTISKSTGKAGQRDSSESYWFDTSTGNIIRYSGTITDADGSQMTPYWKLAASHQSVCSTILGLIESNACAYRS